MQTKQTSKREQRRGEDYLEWGSVVAVVGGGKMVVAAVVLPLFPFPFSFMFFFVFASLFLFSSFVFRWLSPISFIPGFLVLVSASIFSLLLSPLFSSVSFCFPPLCFSLSFYFSSFSFPSNLLNVLSMFFVILLVLFLFSLFFFRLFVPSSL